MPVLKGALHTHTTCSDGQLTPPELVAAYRELGFQFVAITDHDHLLRPNYWDALPKDEPDFLVFKGVELTVFERGYVHVGQIRGHRDTLHIFNHPAEYDLPFEKLIAVISAVASRMPLDCVEVTKKGFYTPEFDVPEIPYPKVVSDDAHTPAMCGRSWITVDSPLQKDAILREIRAGRLTNWVQGRALPAPLHRP